MMNFPSRAVMALSAAVLAAISFTPVHAASHAEEVAALEGKALEDSALGILDKYCSRCHQVGKLTGARKQAGRPEKFGFILNVQRLIDAKLLQPGNPDSSKVFTEITNNSMPRGIDPACNQVFDAEAAKKLICRPTSNETLVLRKFIETLQVKVVKREFIDDDQVIRAIAADLEKQSDFNRPNQRYMTITHLYNAGEQDEALEAYRLATAKLLNSLSSQATPVQLAIVDEARTIMRFDITDLGWDHALWDKILKVNPYVVIYENPLFKFLAKETRSITPFLRADWFIFAASQPPLYHDILELPKTSQELEKKLGINTLANVVNYKIERAAFHDSGVSENNRMIERHEIADGAYWLSYDFAGNKTTQSLFRFPLGPKGAFDKVDKDLAKFVFDHDGGEIIYSLPNGFHAYLLVEADGTRIDKGPQNIVIDDSQRDKAVTNGISCFGCHTEGIKYNSQRAKKREEQDEIRGDVTQDFSFPRKVREIVEEIYPPQDVFYKIQKRDEDIYKAALKAAGIDYRIKLDGVEVINALFKRFERDVGVADASAELGLKPEELLARLNQIGGNGPDLRRRLLRDSVPRDQFVDDFAKLVNAITDNKAIDFTKVKANSKLLGVKQDVAVKPEVSRSFDLAFYPNEEVFKVGKAVTFTVESQQSCYLTIINIDSKDRTQVIFPNRFNKNNKLTGKQKYQLPGKLIPGFKFEFQEAGKERIIAICNASRYAPPGIVHNFDKDAFTSFKSYGDYVANSKLLKISPDSNAGASSGYGSDLPALLKVKKRKGEKVVRDILAQKGIVLNVVK